MEKLFLIKIIFSHSSNYFYYDNIIFLLLTTWFIEQKLMQLKKLFVKNCNDLKQRATN